MSVMFGNKKCQLIKFKKQTMKSNNEKDGLLKRFMKEHFPYGEFKKAGIFSKEMRYDYKLQAECICKYLGLKTIYEYGSEEICCHITYGENERPLHINDKGKLKEEPFITVIPSIY